MTSRSVPVLMLLLATANLAQASADDVQGELRDAVARHPDDPDLAWALARTLADAGSEAAIAVLDRLVTRWPENGQAQLRLGSLLVARGRDAEALDHLDRAVALDPGSGPAHLLLGVSLAHVGRFDEGDAQLVQAAEIEPGLRAESLLLRGIAAIERGDDETGFRLLQEVIELDPLGDVADAARLVLAAASRETRPRLRAQAYGGMDYDSNVTLDSGSTPGVSSDDSDGAGVWGAMLAADPLVGDAYTVTVGARYHERDYLRLDDYDERTVLGFASGQVDFGGGLAGRLSALGSYVMLGNDPYLTQVKLRPELLVWLGPRAGVLQIAACVEGDFYDDDPPFTSLERDGVVFGGSLAQLFTIPGWSGGRGSWGLDYEHVLTDAKRDQLGFQGDYDRNTLGGHLETELPLWWGVSAELEVALTGELYDHDNLVDYLVQLQQDGSAKRRHRRDLFLETGVGLTRELYRNVDLELRWRFQDRFSNTDVYSYDRQIVGAVIRVRTF